MKPTMKSSLPLAFLRFGTALVLFCALGGMVQNSLEQRRNAGRFRGVNAVMLPDGELTYFASRENIIGQPETWEFPEDLQSPRLRLDFQFVVSAAGGQVVRINAKDANNASRQVWPLSGYYSEGGARRPMDHQVWWNGPAGQVDLYDGISRLRRASLGPAGPAVKAPARPAARFEMAHVTQFMTPRCIVTPQGIHAVSPADLSSRLVFQGPCEAFGEAYNNRQLSQGVPAKTFLLVVHGGKLSVLEPPTGDMLRELKLPQVALALINDNAVTSAASFTLFDNGKVAVDGYRKAYNEKTVLLLGADGSLVRRVDYDTEEIEKQINGGVARSRQIMFPTLAPPMPVLMETPALIQSILLSLALSAIVLWHQTRVGRRGIRRAAWTLFAFIFGLLGAATYLVAYRDYRTEPCPACGKRRPVVEADCPHCRPMLTSPP